MINLYDCDIYYKGERIRNIVYIDSEYSQTYDGVYFIKIEYIDDKDNIQTIVDKRDNLKFVIDRSKV